MKKCSGCWRKSREAGNTRRMSRGLLPGFFLSGKKLSKYSMQSGDTITRNQCYINIANCLPNN